MPKVLICLLAMVPSALHSEAQELDAVSILARAVVAAGGDAWLGADTLRYDGTIAYYTRFGPNARTSARYQMWRQFDRDADAPTPTSGRVHIHVANDQGTLLDVGNTFSDDLATETESGGDGNSTNDGRWRNAFALELVRAAHLNEQYQLYRLPDAEIGGQPVYVLRIVSIGGQETIASFDQQSYMLRAVGAQDARSWRHRVFDDFREIGGAGYMQPFSIKLYVNGALAASLALDSADVDELIDGEIFEHRP